jgi:hypothetical protein
MKKLYVLIAVILLSIQGYSASVTPGNTGSSKVCMLTYTTISNIVISESGAQGDFGTASATTGLFFFIVAPSGFEFDPSAGVNANFSGGGNASGASVLFKTTSVIAITYNCDNNSPAKNDNLTISGIAVKALSLSATGGSITMGTGSFAIGGGPFVNDVLANVKSAIASISFSPTTPKCNNDAAYALSGNQSLATGVSVNTQSYSGTGVAGSNFNPTTAGTGTQTLTYTLTTNSPGCTFTTTANVDVNAAPVVTLTVEETSGTASNDGTICDGTPTGDPIVFTGYGASTYKFYRTPASLLSSSSPYTISSPTLSNGDQIYVEGTATNGCKDNSPNKTITINPLPAAPTFNPSNNIFSSADAGFWLDTLGTPAEEANRSAFSASYFTGTGVVYDNASGRYFFYPNVAGNGTHTITYHFVNGNKCESATQSTIKVGTGVSAGNISGINSTYCSYDAPNTISINFCEECFFGCSYYLGMEYSSDGGASWNAMTEISTVMTSSNCGIFGGSYSYLHSYTLNPSTLGAGIKLFRYSYEAYSWFSGYTTYYSPSQSTTIYGLPNISITNTFNSVSCATLPITQLTYTSNGASGVATFSSPTTNFVQLNLGNYFVHWDQGAGATDVAVSRTISLSFKDNVSGCINTVNTPVNVAKQPAPPTFYPGYPLTFCKTDYTYGVVNATGTGYTMEWIKDLPNNPPIYYDNYYTYYYGYSEYFRGVISASELYYTKQYLYAGCESNASAAYDITVNSPVSVNVGQYATVCSNQQINLTQLQKFGPAVTQTWSTYTASPGSFTPSAASNSPSYTLSAPDISRGYVGIRVTTADPDGPQGCPAVYKDTIVNINLLPVITATTPLPVYCSSNLITLNSSVNNSSALPITWYKGSVGGSQTGIGSVNSTVTSFTPSAIEKAGGAITFFSQSTDPDGPAGPCAAVNTSVTLTINPEVVISAGSPIVTCGTSNISLSGSCVKFGGVALAATWTGGTGGAGAYIPNNTSLVAAYTPTVGESTGTSIMFTLTSADPDGAGPCTALSSSVTNVVNQAPSINAGPDAYTCSSTDPTLTAVLSNGATGITWTRIGVGGTINTPTNTTTTYTIPNTEKTGATVTFVATSNDTDGPGGPCISAVDQVSIFINPEVQLNGLLPITPVTTCGSNNVPLSATCVTYGGGNLAATWTKGVYNSGLIPAATNPKNASYAPTLAEATVGGPYTYTLTSADPDGAGPTGPCPALSISVTNTINPAPFVNAGTDASWCSNTNPILSATYSGSANNITWTKNTGSGTIASITSPTTNYNVAAGDYALGSTFPINFTATTDDPDGPLGPCIPATDVVTITLNPHLTANVGTDIVVCAGQTINLAGNVKIGGINRTTALTNSWSIVPLFGAGGITQNGPDNFTGVYSPSGNVLSNTGELGLGGNIKLVLASTDPDGVGPTGPCLAVTDTLNITINQRARVSAGADTVYCANDVMQFNGNVLTGSANFVTWSGRPITSFNSANVINPIYTPIAPTELYGNSYSPSTGLILPNQITFTITGNDPDGAGPCVAESDNMIVSINPKVTVNAGTDLAFCGHALQPTGLKTLINTSNIKLGNTDRTNTAATNTWSVYTGSGTLSGMNFPSNFNVNYTPSGVLADSGTVTSIGSGEFGNLSNITLMLKSNDPDGTGPCKADSDFVNITVYPRPITHFSGFATEYCKNTPSVNISGNLSSTITGNATFSVVGAVNTSVSTSGDFYVFSPINSTISNNGASFQIEYKQKDAHSCYNFVDTLVNVFPIPKVAFTPSTRCQYDTITFTNTSTICSSTNSPANSIFPGTQLDWDWYIDGDSTEGVYAPTVSSLNTPITKYAFANYGNHGVKLIVTTNSGGTLNCINKLDTTLIFGPYPNTNFSWTSPCSVDSVSYINGTTIPAGYINSISWNMNDLNNTLYKGGTNNSSPNPYYKFAQPGIYNVQLTAKTNIYNCTKVKTKEVYIVPTYTITPSSPYDSAFATSGLQWAPSGFNNDSTYSWQHGTPSGKHVINPGHNTWITNLTGDYKIGELSYLNSPCFNFSTLDKPMLVMNMWSNTTNLAGAVLEATTVNTSNPAATNPWVTIGTIGSGINWYNTAGIVGLIGTSGSNPTAQGFSGLLNNWDISRIGLSQYANQSNLVRFRLVFGSSNVNDPLNKKDGIALDSIWIGNRSKVVLLEHFTNSLCPTCMEANDTVNSIQTHRPADVISVHYHTSFPGVDNMNLKEPSAPSSKVLYYGVSTVPRTFLDGTQSYAEYGSTGSPITLSAIDNKALENSKFTLDVSSKKTGLNLSVRTQLVAKEALSQDVILNVAVLEKFVQGGSSGVGGNQSGYKWVLKKTLPDAAGNYISKVWNIGDTLKMLQNWDFTSYDFYDTSQIEVVAFVQNYTTKEVYQAARVASNGNTSSTPIVTSVDVQDIADNLLIYPVPADNEVNVMFAGDLTTEVAYTLSNDLGQPVEQGTLEKGVRMLSFNTKKLAAGLYHLSISKEDGSKVHRKIVVVH